MGKPRVVITGMGIISPLGTGLSANWDNVISGVSGIRKISRFDIAGYPSQIAGEISDFAPEQFFSGKDIRKMDRFIQFGMVAGIEAFADSGLEVNDQNADRIGVYIGSGIGGMESIERYSYLLRDKGPRRVSPFYVPMSIINMISGNLSIRFGLKGPNLSMVTACSTSTHAIGEASRLIEYGDADVMIAGGAEAAITPTSMAGFGNAKALSRRNDEPELASCPWDVERDGFVMGEGAGVLVLEELNHARARGATIYAELAGFGMSADAHHMTSPLPDGEGACRCMSNALRNATLNPEDIDYINAHGTSTPQGDIAETIATRSALGHHADHVAVSSTKSMTGHLLGAAGGIEAIFTAMAIQKQMVPPTINLHSQDPACDLDYVPNSARELHIRAAISNSFGFGGTNGSLVFKRYH